MKPVFLFAPYWMGEYSLSRAAITRHTWRLLPPIELEGAPTERMGQLCAALVDEVAAIRAAGNFPVVIVGDCTFSIGVLAALQGETPDLTLVWYDAHGDFNTHETTPSGFIGGMPLAMLCGRGEQTIVAGAKANVQPEANVILSDARDLDPGEKEAVAASEVKHLADVAEVSKLELPDQSIYIHFDCDVLQLSDLSAVTYPAEGGPTLETIDASLAHLAKTGRVTAISVTMWNPELDDDGTAEQVVMGIVERFLEQM